MKINWINILIDLAMSVLGSLNLPAPILDVLKKLLEQLLQSPMASGVAAAGVGVVGYSLVTGMGGGMRAAAKRLRHALNEARDAADELGGVTPEFTAALSTADSQAAPIIEAAIKREKRQKAKQQIPDE